MSTLFFNHYVEQCVTSYPSPLDDHAPFFAKVSLLAIAGAFEYLAYSGFACLIGYAIVYNRGLALILLRGWDYVVQ